MKSSIMYLQNKKIKLIFLSLLLTFQLNVLSQSKFIESDSIVRNYSEYFKKIDKNFQWYNFSFDSSYSNYVNNLESLTSQEEEIFINKYSTMLNDSNIVYRFNNISEFINLPFDNTYIRFGVDLKSQYYEELVFDRNLTDSNEASINYKKYLKELTVKLGEPKTWGYFSLWAGKNIYIKFVLTDDNKLELEVGKYTNRNYISSLKFKYDYYCTSELFKEIDENYSFRGIKFETPLDKIKQITKLTPATEEAKYMYITLDDKYTQWNQIEFGNKTYFGFNSESKLSEVNLFWVYQDYESHTEFQSKVNELLGSPSFVTDNLSYWYGKKINIILDNTLSDTQEGFTLLKLVSNKLKTKKDKYY